MCVCVCARARGCAWVCVMLAKGVVDWTNYLGAKRWDQLFYCTVSWAGMSVRFRATLEGCG